MKIIVATIKSWNIENFKLLSGRHDYFLVTKKEDLNPAYISTVNPDYIFFPHWSWVIPESIHENFKCVVFHMTDLPYGRGGSPLQNLIVRGHKTTKISALRAVKECDAGPVYMKKDLDLAGTCEDILKRSSHIIFKDMIPFILEHHPEPEPQTGRVVLFDRRNFDDGDIGQLKSVQKVYDHIRMLDGEGYPRAFIRQEKGGLIFEFSDARLDNGEIRAEVRIRCEK
jgi:methionyl-tRNA formyltransferase